MKKFLALLAVAASVATSGHAFAHGEAARHGGIVQESSSGLSLELVNRDGKTLLYVEDHGKPVPTAGAAGKLTVVGGGGKFEVPLEPAGDNALAAKGDARLTAGAKAIASVTLADKKVVNVRFAIK